MATTPLNIVLKYKAVQYDGTNSAQLNSLLTYFDVITESAGTLVFDSSGMFTAHTNDYVVYSQGNCQGVFSPTDFNSFYDCNSTCADTAGFASGVVVRSAGVASCGSFLLNQTKTVSVTLNPVMPNTSYSAYATLFTGTVSITGLQINSVTVVSASVVDVVIQSVGLVTASGSNVMVIAKA